MPGIKEVPLFMGTGGGSNPLLLQWLIIELLDSCLPKALRLQAVPDYPSMVALG